MAYRQASAFRNLELLVQNSFTRRQLSRTIVRVFSLVTVQADVIIYILHLRLNGIFIFWMETHHLTARYGPFYNSGVFIFLKNPLKDLKNILSQEILQKMHQKKLPKKYQRMQLQKKHLKKHPKVVHLAQGLRLENHFLWSTSLNLDLQGESKYTIHYSLNVVCVPPCVCFMWISGMVFTFLTKLG